MKFEELNDEQISKMSDIYWNRDLTWDQRMKSLSDLIGKSERTIQNWISKLGITEKDYTVCFQSRLDKKWLHPFSDKIVEEQGKKGAKKLLVFSPAFIADCLETIVEIGEEYQEIFEEFGGEKVQLVSSSNDHPLFINCLETLVRERL